MTAQGNFQRIELTRKERDRFGRIRTLDQMKKMDPVEFEKYCGYLYEQQGYRAHMTATTGDEGIDLLLKKGAETIVVQCKRYAGTVGQPTVRDLYGTMVHNRANAAALVTTGKVSRQAEQWAAGKPIHLVDGHELTNWARYTRLGVAAGVGNWFGRNWRTLLIGLGLVVTISAFFFLTSLAVNTFRDRSKAAAPEPDGGAIIIPTEMATVVSAPTNTPSPEPVETDEPTVTPETTLTIAPTATLAPTPEPETAVPDFSIEALAFDGAIGLNSSEWDSITPILTNQMIEEFDAWDGTVDAEATWQLGWDSTNLYGLVTVVDDVHVQTSEARAGYLGDSLELEVDTNFDRADRALEDDYQYVISAGNFADIAPGAFRFRGGEGGTMSDEWGTRAQVQAEQTADGYRLFFVIPWFDMGLTRQSEAGRTIGVSLTLNDTDTVGAAQQEVVFSNVADRQWSKPNTWGSLTLDE